MQNGTTNVEVHSQTHMLILGVCLHMHTVLCPIMFDLLAKEVIDLGHSGWLSVLQQCLLHRWPGFDPRS
jgi:hypothetical protein